MYKTALRQRLICKRLRYCCADVVCLDEYQLQMNEYSENPTSHSYFSQRLRLHFLDWGNNDSRGMLLVHGIQDHCRSWDWLAQSFRSRYHIVAPDLRGHGDSEWSKGATYSRLEYVYDLAQLVKQQELNPVTVVSHSLGGTIASIYAGLYPENIEKLIIIEGIGFYPRSEANQPAALIRDWISTNHQLAGRIPKRYVTQEDAYLRMQKTNPHLSPGQARHLTQNGSNRNEDGTYSWKFDNYTRSRTPYDVPEKDMQQLWGRIDCPVLIINSKQGYPNRIGQNGTLKYFSDVRLIEIDKAGHWTHHDQLRQVIDAVDSFLIEH
tara:strand:- start:204 stop:1169 length:966 start_codon:yes stop_codon:yes gene_type:complete